MTRWNKIVSWRQDAESYLVTIALIVSYTIVEAIPTHFMSDTTAAVSVKTLFVNTNMCVCTYTHKIGYHERIGKSDLATLIKTDNNRDNSIFLLL